MKTIFVTGSEGFIGSHLIEKLVHKGYKVKALVLYNSFNKFGWLDYINKDISRNIEIIPGDIRDADLIQKKTKKIDTIINLAALIAIPYSYEAVESYISTNIVGLNNILKASLHNNCKLIHTSTSEVYGDPKKFPLNEKDFVFAKSPYAATKIAGDQLCFSYYRSFGLPVTVLRPFNTFGPRQSYRAIIPTIIGQMLNMKKKEILLGNIYPKRNFNFYKDIISGILQTIDAKKVEGELINLGGNYEISIQNLVTEISKIFGIKVKIVSDYKRLRPKKSEVNRLLSNSAKAKKILKWKPEYDNKKNFIKALNETVAWYKKNHLLFDCKDKIYNI